MNQFSINSVWEIGVWSFIGIWNLGFENFCSIIVSKMGLKKLLAIPVLMLGLLIVFQLSRSIISMWGRGGRVEELKAEVAGLEKEKEELEREKAFRETAEFVEREARDKLRMVKEGERIVVLPEGQNEERAESGEPRAESQEKPNWKKWVDFWFR